MAVWFLVSFCIPCIPLHPQLCFMGALDETIHRISGFSHARECVGWLCVFCLIWGGLDTSLISRVVVWFPVSIAFLAFLASLRSSVF